jgi:cysteinyl-tRNA synthetase
VAVVRETLRSDVGADEKRWLVLDADLVLGLDLDRPAAAPEVTTGGEPSEDERALLAARDQARAAHDWARADALRVQLAAAGIEVADGPGGTTWRRSGGGGG